MASETTINDLPLEMLYFIANVDEETYRGILSIPNFARSIKPGVMIDYMIKYGYSIKITNDSLLWLKLSDNIYQEHTPWDSSPNMVCYEQSDGYIKRLTWSKNGLPYRKCKRPTVISLYYIPGKGYSRAVEWKNEKLEFDREDKPAILQYYSRTITKSWYINGVEGRANGKPARISLEYRNPFTITSNYYLKGRLYKTKVEYRWENHQEWETEKSWYNQTYFLPYKVKKYMGQKQTFRREIIPW